MGSQTGIPRAHGNLNERAESKARSVERRARDGLASPTQVLLPLGSGPSLYDVTSTILPRLCRSLSRSFSFSFSLFYSNSWLQRPAFSVSLLRSHLTFLPLDTLPFSVFPLPLSLSSPSPPFNLAPSRSVPVSATVLAAVSPVPSRFALLSELPVAQCTKPVRLYSLAASISPLATVPPQPRLFQTAATFLAVLFQPPFPKCRLPFRGFTGLPNGSMKNGSERLMGFARCGTWNSLTESYEYTARLYAFMGNLQLHIHVQNVRCIRKRIKR